MTIVVRGDNQIARIYKLDYTQSASTGRSLLKYVQEYGNDAGVDPGGIVIPGQTLPLSPVSLDWNEQKAHSFLTGQEFLMGFSNSCFCGNECMDFPHLAFGDFNGDSRADIILPATEDGKIIKFSNGDGTFTDGPDIPETSPGQWANCNYGDFNGDGKTDIVHLVCNFPQFQMNFRIKFSNGDGTFTDSALIPFNDDNNNQYSNNISYRDFDGDGKIDIIYHTTTENGKRIRFSNGDGKTDIIYLRDSYGTMRIKFSNGDGTFTDSDFFYIEDIYSWGPLNLHLILKYGDFNGDQRTDVLYKTTSGGFRIKFSNGDGTFTDGEIFYLDMFNGWFTQLADFNGDAKIFNFRTQLKDSITLYSNNKRRYFAKQLAT
ncbi:MAG: VCBS repeat-containing protein, partial [Deltaproteobacteria bacterium]|nr:VCBS repeat-containing protein [Deltaproteobacteria bacterium]